MDLSSQPIKKSPPVCGALSVAAPFAGAAVGFLVAVASAGGAEWSPIIRQLWAVVAFLLAGFLLALIGVSRHERCAALPWIALFLNGIPLLYLFVTYL